MISNLIWCPCDNPGSPILQSDHIDIGRTFPSCERILYTDDYRVDISYAAYWIKNLLFIFEKGILTFLDQIVA